MKRQNWTESQLLCKKVENTILKYQLIEKGDKLVVAVSGGPDSICLLDYLRQCSQFNLSFHIIVAHLNHGLRKEADEEEEYVKNYCEKNEIGSY